MNSFLHRRDWLKGVGILLAGGCAPRSSWDQSVNERPSGSALQPSPIQQTQLSVPLGATVGSLVGSGYGIPAYRQYASVAPDFVRSDFDVFAARPNIQTQNAATRSYIEFRRSTAQTRGNFITEAVFDDVSRDSQSTGALLQLFLFILSEVRRIRSDRSALISELLDSRERVERTVHEIQAERSRAVGSANCTSSVTVKVADARLPKSEELKAVSNQNTSGLLRIDEVNGEIIDLIRRS